MGQIRLPDNPGIQVTVRRSRRARRLSLRVSSLDGRVTLTLPRGVSETEGARFVAQKAEWISDALRAVPLDLPVGEGASIPVEGISRRIVTERRRGVALEGARLRAPNRGTASAIGGHLKHLARERAAAAIDRYAAMIGKSPGRLTLRDTRSRWGSCSTAGDLMISWRLILAPPEVLDYVAAHEVAHLVHMDHSAAFWSVVSRLRPDWRDSRDWLRAHGADLHRYRFEGD